MLLCKFCKFYNIIVTLLFKSKCLNERTDLFNDLITNSNGRKEL